VGCPRVVDGEAAQIASGTDQHIHGGVRGHSRPAWIDMRDELSHSALGLGNYGDTGMRMGLNINLANSVPLRSTISVFNQVSAVEKLKLVA
jgi:hypothetical protein